MSKFARALGNALLTVLVLILIVYGWAFIEMKILLKSQPEFFEFAFYLQKSDDMMPEINMNDVIIIKKNEMYNQGDAILYFDSNDSKYKLHYVVSTDNDTVTTKNAITKEYNSPIRKENVVGKAIRKVAFFGAIVSFFKQKIVLLIIGIFGITFLVISQYMEYKPKKKAEEQN